MDREMVEEFIEIYKEFYKESISNGDAREMAQNLLNAYKIVYRMPPEKVAFGLDSDGLDR